jgi:hypothetical protein
MQINKRNRTELKQYFVKNAIPTDSNFAELIDGMLNQRDDGIARQPNDPLSIEAAGDPQKKALQLYNSFADSEPAWVLSLKPRQTQGFGIGDAAGNSRLFIERTTGRLGVGTVNPVSDVTIRRDVPGALGPILTLYNGSDSAGAGGAIDFNGYNVGPNPPSLRLESLDDGNFSSHLAILTKSSGAAGNALVERMRVSSGGKVGIGTTTPQAALHIDRGATNDLALLLSSSGPGWGSGLQLTNTASGASKTFGIYAGAGALHFVDVDASVDRMMITKEGLVQAPGGALLQAIGIGTQTFGPTRYPYETIQMNSGHNLRIWFGETERFLFGSSGELMIRFDHGYWTFQADGNLVKRDNSNNVIWALNASVATKWGWS